MRIESFDPAVDLDQARACYWLYASSQLVDDPGGPTMSERVFTGLLRQGWSGERQEMFLASDAGGVCGSYVLELPHHENRHLGTLVVRVAPDRRRRGYGAGLLRHAADLARTDGRTMLSGATWGGTGGGAFAAAMGARSGLVEIRRVLDLGSIPPGHLGRLRARAGAASAGYSLLSWTGTTPDEHLEQVALVTSAMADAPRSPAEQAARIDAQRIRADELRAAGRGISRYTVVARCDRTGELAGLTRISVDEGDPAWGLQRYTVVTRAHRGHRLGLLLKVAMLDQLASAEPGLCRIVTENADTNQHMVAINDELGFRPRGEWKFWELDPAAIRA